MLPARGVRVVAIGTSAERTAIFGETLAPSILEPLMELDLEDEFHALNMIPVSGFESTWGLGTTTFRPALTSSIGAGWLFDRRAFEEMLRTRAARLGVVFIDDRVGPVRRFANGTWQIASAKAHVAVNARFIVHCHGRANIGLQSFGDSICIDHLVACIGSIPSVASGGDRVIRVD